MSQALYPSSPTDIPQNLTKPAGKYKQQALIAMIGLVFFMSVYLALSGFFSYVSYVGIMKIVDGEAKIQHFLLTAFALILAIFMLKALFVKRRAAMPHGMEITEQDEPELFSFLHQLSDEIGAPKPHRVFLTPEVNAAVFYDLSLLNLIFPSKKNLNIGMGLVNVLSLGELKAVLAHEFGHFSQKSMVVGRWVYVAQQIISYMVATRDWLDKLVGFISRIDLRIAWIGWMLSLIIWSIRSLMETLFSIVVIAERALSRQMEFNADLVAVSVTGSDALVHALHKLQSADQAWQTALNVAQTELTQGKQLSDIFEAQTASMSEMRRVLDDEHYGTSPKINLRDPASHRVFDEDSARPPQMWATHPANSDREANAKSHYVASKIDERSSWALFKDAEKTRQFLTNSFYTNTEGNLEPVSSLDAVVQLFDRPSYNPKYRGSYLSRSPVRAFTSVDEIITTMNSANTIDALNQLYPESISEIIESHRNVVMEQKTLEALATGELKPSGGVIRHRGEELKKREIPAAIALLNEERLQVSEKLKDHDRLCRSTYIEAAKTFGNGWDDYLTYLLRLLHCVEHLHAHVENEQALLINTWQVITADGQIGHFEKKRILKVCKNLTLIMAEVSSALRAIELCEPLKEKIGVNDWEQQCPVFAIDAVTKKNWPQWCQVASQVLSNMSSVMSLISSVALEELISIEENISEHIRNGDAPEAAPASGRCPDSYPVLLPGEEYVLQRKLDLWNRFQLAHGFFPTLMRSLVSLSVVGGTVYGGVLALTVW